MVAETGVYEKAISRLPPMMQVERARRMKRAFDLSQKHEEIPEAARVRGAHRLPACRCCCLLPPRPPLHRLAAPLPRRPPSAPAPLQENPWREYKQVQEVLSATQREQDERMVLSDRPFIPFNLGRENWFGYDTKTAWWWGGKAK